MTASRSSAIHAARVAAAAVAALALLRACDYPEFSFAPWGTGAATSASSGHGPGGTTSQSTGGAAATGGSSSGGTGGTAHGGAGAVGGTGAGGGATPCALLDEAACPEEKCSVVDEVTGATGCVAAGLLAAWNVCASDADCVRDHWCDHATGVCKPVCSGVGDCPDVTSQCLPATAGGGGPIPGLRLCVANCDPRSPACGPHTNCVYLGSPPLFDCFSSLDHQDGDSCGADRDCASGLMCTDAGDCRLWCDTPGEVFSWCKTGVWCCSLDPAPFYDGHELGYCACP